MLLLSCYFESEGLRSFTCPQWRVTWKVLESIHLSPTLESFTYNSSLIPNAVRVRELQSTTITEKAPLLTSQLLDQHSLDYY